MADVKRFIAAAHTRGIRVITELVINHTSDQHAWFQRARKAKPGSPARNFYVWSDTDQKYSGTRIIFLDTERSNWTWDPVAGAYYWHRFYSHQPDLNFDNPKVLEAILGVMRFWLELGVDGLRLDAVPYLIEREALTTKTFPRRTTCCGASAPSSTGPIRAGCCSPEANQWPEDTKDYFGQGDECHMAFHFPLMPRMYMALAREDRFPITDIMRQTPQIPETCQWAIFLRNHDELTLEMVTDSERDYLWEDIRVDRRARLNLGIRRRLTPLLERDRRRIELMNCLLLSMPGTPVIYYGDEIGMGDNIHLGDRDGVRTPMQWTPDRNGGFSRADPAALVLPTLMDPLYGYETVNVEAQLRDRHSLLHWMRRMLAIRRRHPAFGRGTLRFLYPKNRKVLAFLREHDGEIILCVASVSRAPEAVELDLSELAGRVPVELSGGSLFPPIGQLTYLLTLPPYGFYWFVLAAQSEPPAWHTLAPEPMPEYITLVTRNRIVDALTSADGAAFVRDVLPSYLMKRRWFSAKDQSHQVQRASRTCAAAHGDREIILARNRDQGGPVKPPLAVAAAVTWDRLAGRAAASQLALARVRRRRAPGS
jgi:maltose alpha-D-glucosyltransferase/alpha-amylase